MKPSVLVTIVVVLLIPIIAFMYTRSSGGSSSNSTPTPTATPSTIPDAVSATKVALVTDKGTINLTLYPDIAPLAVKNFVTLGKRGYYNNTYFHRIIADFMIQGGDPTGTGTGGESIYGTGFANEIGDKKFVKGSLGMANTGQPNSNGSQFFIVTQTDQPSLDGSYTLFGQVADDASMAVVDAIAATPVTTGPSGENSQPTEKIHITAFQILQ